MTTVAALPWSFDALCDWRSQSIHRWQPAQREEETNSQRGSHHAGRSRGMSSERARAELLFTRNSRNSKGYEQSCLFTLDGHIPSSALLLDSGPVLPYIVGGLSLYSALNRSNKSLIDNRCTGQRVISYNIYPKICTRSHHPGKENKEILNFRFTLPWLVERIPDLTLLAEGIESYIKEAKKEYGKSQNEDPLEIAVSERKALSMRSVIEQIIKTDTLYKEIQIIRRDLYRPMASIAFIVLLSILGILLLQLTLFKDCPVWPNSIAILVFVLSVGTMVRVIYLILKWTGSRKKYSKTIRRMKTATV